MSKVRNTSSLRKISEIENEVDDEVFSKEDCKPKVIFYQSESDSTDEDERYDLISDSLRDLTKVCSQLVQFSIHVLKHH